jgi:uncharacterized membrane protein YagU involved in acid resistance
VPAGLFLCVASATWGDAGVFSPFYRIAGVLDRAAYDISLEEAANGSRFWLELQTTLPGVCVHLALAGLFGMLFFLVTRELPSTRPAVVVAAGVVWGLLVALLMVPVLGLVGREVGGGALITDAPSQMGWSTYLLMHLVYGSSLGAVVALVRRG